jgi:hypothetical protein
MRLERIKVQATTWVSRAELISADVEEKESFVGDTIGYNLYAFITGIGKEKHRLVLRTYDGWFEHAKAELLPEWVLDWWPVKYTEIADEVTCYKAVCPHRAPDAIDAHVKFLLDKDSSSE